MEIALFIEDVVTGQQPFARHQAPAAALHQGHGVEQPLATGFNHPKQQPKPWRQGATELIELAVLLLPQGRLQQQITGWIAPEGELRG